jgi:hypothetical protein
MPVLQEVCIHRHKLANVREGLQRLQITAAEVSQQFLNESIDRLLLQFATVPTNLERRDGNISERRYP